MSNCIKCFYDYDLVKKCCRCGIISLKSDFHKNNLSMVGAYKRCRLCQKQHYKEKLLKKRYIF